MTRASSLLAAVSAVTLCLTGVASPAPVVPSSEPGAVDPYGWLEDVHSPRSLAWVADQNRTTAARLEADPRFETFRKAALAVLTRPDRIPAPVMLGGGVANFWQDKDHVKGLWRWTSAESFSTASPQWHTLIDLDALSKAQGRNLIFKGAHCLAPEDRFCLVHLSDGGGDAVEVREFDRLEGRFVEGGFFLPAGKQSATYLDRDTLIIARDFGPGTLTKSGYPFIVKRLKRGEPLSSAIEVFRGAPDDVQARAVVLRKADGARIGLLFERGDTFFTRQHFLETPDGPRKLDLPPKSELHGNLGGLLVVGLNEDFTAQSGQTFKAGDLISLDLATGAHGLIARPSASQSFSAVAITQSGIAVQLLDTVNGAVDLYRHDGGGWSARRLELPKGLAISLQADDPGSDDFYLNTEGFLDPTSQWRVNAETGLPKKIRSLPALFDSSSLVVEQKFAASTDGVKIPYFLVRPKNLKPDGKTPVQMFGYGGFLVSETPTYRPELGKLWLERGGAYVLTNIRGGGEFGPAWHEAALRQNRQRAFDDFAAVAKDLIATGVTSPARLGIYGRSNGGVLTSVSITQHPELFGAAVIESPLVDMLRYTHLSAGASWAAEYGDPDVASDRAFIAAYSAYTRLQPGVAYPEAYITTNTEDDRVHPGHARKLAAALQGLGDKALYYENTFGGHANDADPELNARRWARHYVYLSQKLMDPAP